MPPKKEKAPLFQPKDKVLAKMTGFPAWPSFVMPLESIPTAILGAKKKTTNTCVIFIPDGDFYWMNEKSLEALSPEKLQSKIDKIPKDKLKGKAKKKSARTSNVVEALLAANGLQFDDFMADLEKAKASLNEEEDEAEEDEAEAEAEEVEDADEDEKTEDKGKKPDDLPADTKDPETVEKEEDKDEEEHTPVLPARTNTRHATRGAGRGRGRMLRSAREEPTVETPEENEDPVVNGAADDSGNEEDNESTSDASKQNAPVPIKEAALTRKRTRGSRGEEITSNVEEDGGDAKQASDGTEEPLPKKAATATAATTITTTTRDSRSNDKDRQHQLWLCRIKLQRSLIQRNQPVTPKDPKSFPPPTVDELLMARIILQKLADFPVTIELLRDTKIHKVLKCIVKDEDLEYPESFRLHEKCKELLDKWHDLIESLKQGKPTKLESRIGSAAPEDSEISGVEIKPAADKQTAAKVGV